MSDLFLYTGETRGFKVIFLDALNKPIVPPQQMNLVSSDPAIAIGPATAKDTFNITGGLSPSSAPIALKATAPGINNGNASYIFDVVSNQQAVAATPPPGPTAASATSSFV